MWLIYLAILVILECIADIFTKEHSIKRTAWTFILAVSLYATANVSYLMSMRHNSKLAISANIFSVSTGIIATFIGVVIYKENLTSLHITGISLGCISLILLLS